MKIKIIDALMGMGKAQPINAQVVSEQGYKEIGQLNIGDKIYGEDGELHRVIGIFPQGKKEIYRITFSDGTSTECCKEHLWIYQTPFDKTVGKYRIESLETISNKSLYKETNRGDKNWQYYIPITLPLNFNEQKLNIHPYIMGALLGDGGFYDKRGSIAFTNIDDDIISKFKEYLNDRYELSLKNNKSKKTNTYVIKDNLMEGYNNRKNTFKTYIREYGLMGKKSYSKFIPKQYMINSIENRIMLLSGLIDTDGSVINKNSYSYSTTSKQMANDIIFIVESLGGTCHLIDRQTQYVYNNKKNNGRISYRLTIKLDIELKIASKSKKEKNKIKNNTSPHRTIRSIEKLLDKKECVCIAVDNKTHLYLTNNMIVTHNTSALINYINQSNDDIKFLYITPYLTEVDRIIQKCPNKKFRQPDAFGKSENKKTNGSKIKGIKYLFEKGVNIVSTHSLFRSFDQEIIDLAYNNNYILIMDEVAEVIQPLDISKDDLETLLEKYTKIINGHLLKWTASTYEGHFEKYKRLCELECIGIYDNVAILWLFPISTFRAFKEIYILTYLFKAQTQKYYFDLYNIEYDYLYVSGNNVDNYNLTEEFIEYEYQDYKKLINICDSEKLNQIGDLDTSLSVSWYQRNQNNKLMQTLKNNTTNFFKNYTKTKTQLNLWTTFKNYQPFISGKGYTKGFLSSNIRATNDYKDRIAIAYLVNKFFNPHIKNFFVMNGVEVDEDSYALSEMIQFIWRSAIRENNEIWLYIPSNRMRNILKNWIEKISTT